MDLRSWLSALGGAPAGGTAYGMAAPPMQSPQPMGLAVPPMARGTKLSAEMDYDGTHPRQQEQAARDHFRSYGPQTLADAFIPGYGAGGDAKAASEAYGEGRYGAAALNAGMAALDFVPVLGALPAAAKAAMSASDGVKAAERVAKMLREGKAAKITNRMLDEADPAHLFALYETGQTGADMPMDFASRMARAGEMGFDGPAYHGTTADISVVNPKASQMGSSHGTGERAALWAATDPKTAETYLPGAFVRAEAGGVPYESGGAARYYADGTNIVPTMHDRTNEDLWDFYGGAYPSRGLGGEISEARRDGRSSVVFRGIKDQGLMGLGSGNPRNTTIAALKPNAVRSLFARFDPRLAHLAHLSAGVGGLAVLGPEIERYLSQDGMNTGAQ